MACTSEESHLAFSLSTRPISWTGKAIARLSLHRRAPVYTRLDLFPFVLIYTAVITVIILYSLSRFFAVALFVSCALLHILAFLVQHWSLKAKTFISWTRANTVDLKEVADGSLFALIQPKEHRGRPELVQLKADDSTRVYFYFQKRTYEFNEAANSFEKVIYPAKLPISHYLNSAQVGSGLNGNVLRHTVSRFGLNKLEIPFPTFIELYIENLLAPFFVFQVFCIFLWLLDEYWKYSLMTLFMMLVFEATVVFGRLRSLKELRGMRNPTRIIHTYRDGKWLKMSSIDLLPGDVVSIGRSQDPSHVVPCDLLILSGNAVVNEAILTGESVPQMKEAISLTQNPEQFPVLSVKDKHKGHILFGGTRILTHSPGANGDRVSSLKSPDSRCICYVLRTGFGSFQGKLLRTILFSTESVSANSAEAAVFILFLLVFAIAASGYVLFNRYTNDADSRYKLLLRCVLIITSVVPPELPMQLALAVNTSLVALAKNLVFCTEPYRIPYAGKIDICCFDKTGTLTTDSIVAAGVSLPSPTSQAPGESFREEYAMVPVANGTIDSSLVLASCHSLVFVDNEIIGDPLELAALESAQWMYGRSGACVPKRGGASVASGKVLQRYRFTSALQRMSVIADIGGSSTRNGPRVLAKGSPEAIWNLLRSDCRPKMYHEVASKLARGGMRVLALAHKHLPSGMTASQLMKMSRAEVESELMFVGFVCFECPLRSDSRKVVQILKKSNHKVMMITGDATLTAAHVATQVGICTKSILILNESEVSTGTLEWFSAKTGKRKKRYSVGTTSNLAEEFDLCVGGPALQLAIALDANMKSTLKYIKVFARMSPVEKENVLTSLKEEGMFTLMCGDGTNDVGALKQAHVGVALLSVAEIPMSKHDDERIREDVRAGQDATPSKSSNLRQRKRTKSSPATKYPRVADGERGLHPTTRSQVQQENVPQSDLSTSLAETDEQPPLVKYGDASIASPFTSRRMTIDSCVSIIRQGRCTLATTLQMYQILALNCLISAYSLSVLYLRGVMLGDKQMTVTGLVLAVASFMVSRSKPLKKLSPKRPASTVFAPELFLSLLGQFGVHVAALIACVRFVEPHLPKDYCPDIDAEFEPSLMNSAVFLLSIAQQISVYLLNYKGRPFMQGIFDNKPLLNSILVAAGILTVCTLEISPDINEFMELVPWPSSSLQVQIIGVIIFDLVAAFVVDRLANFLFGPRNEHI